MAGLTVDQLSASFDARLDNNAQNLILFSGSFNTRIEELQEGSVLGKVNTLSGSHTALSASFTSNSASFNSRINTIKASELALSASVSDDVTSVTADINSLNDFSASITSSFNSLSASVSSNSASFNSRINTLRAGGVTFEDFNALTQSLSGVISSSAQLNNATITNLTITNLTTINETASVVFSSGSNQFGDNLDDTQILSGSVHIIGSGSLNGYTLLTSNNTSSFLTSLNGALSSSAQVLNGSGIFSSSAQLPSGLVSSSIVGTSAQLAIFGADNSLTGNTHLNLTNGNQTLAVGTLGYTVGNPEALLVTNILDSINIVTIKATQDDYAQVNIINQSAGVSASTDLVVTADNGTESDIYVNVGINSSNYNKGEVGFANDGYVINAGNDLYIGSLNKTNHGHVHIFGGGNWQSSSISIYDNGTIGINTDKYNNSAGTIPTEGYAVEISGSTKFNNKVSITSSLEVSGSTLFSELTGSLSSFSSSINTRINNGASIDTTSFATTGSNAFTGSQNINGDLIITGSTLSVKKSTDSDSFFIVDADSKRLTLGQGNGEIPGEFYLALSGSSAFSPRPEKTLLYGARGFKFQTNQGTVSEFTGSLTISSSAAVDLKVIGKMDVTGSLHISSSNSIDWYMPQLSLYQRNPSEAQSGLTLNHWNNTLDAYSSLQLYAFSNESWIQSTEKILKISGPTVQLSGLNSDPGNVNVIGKLNVTGSMGVSGSIIPAVGSGETTSSFSLGSSTAAWKDLWVSNGTINFLGADGTPQGTLSSTANGLQLGSSTISGSMVITGSLTIVNALGNGQKILGADGILGANYIAGNSGYLGVENGMTRSVQPIISSYFTNYYTTINSAPYKWEMADLGIGSTYSWNYGRFTPSPAIRVGHNTDLSFYTGSSSNIYSPGFSTIISSNNNLSSLERNETVAYSNGINHVLAVTGSLLSRDNTTLGTKATDLTYIRGVATISGSLMISGSLTTSGSINMGELNTIGTFGNLIVGSSNVATGSAGVVIGNGSSANGQFAVSLGSSLQSDGQSSLAQGANNKALENYTHAEGQSTRATGLGAHSEGSVTLASGEFAHSEGRLTTASADYSNAKGVGTIAAGVGQLAIGKYNIADNTTSLFVIGNGVDGSNRKDIVNVTTSSVNISGSLTVSSSAAVDVNVIGTMNVTGSLEVSSSNTLTWYTPKLDIYNPNPSDATSFQLNKYDTSLGGYYNFTIRNNGDANNGTWLTNGGQPIKLMTSTIQLSGNNGDPGIVNVIGTMNVTGSVVLVPQGAPTSPASGSLYFSSADSHFYGWNGLVWKQLDN